MKRIVLLFLIISIIGCLFSFIFHLISFYNNDINYNHINLIFIIGLIIILPISFYFIYNQIQRDRGQITSAFFKNKFINLFLILLVLYTLFDLWVSQFYSDYFLFAKKWSDSHIFTSIFMTIYFFNFTILYSIFYSWGVNKYRKCKNDHIMLSNSLFCPKCGEKGITINKKDYNLKLFLKKSLGSKYYRRSEKCPNGHLVSWWANYCDQCGVKLSKQNDNIASYQQNKRLILGIFLIMLFIGLHIINVMDKEIFIKQFISSNTLWSIELYYISLVLIISYFYPTKCFLFKALNSFFSHIGFSKPNKKYLIFWAIFMFIIGTFFQIN